MGRIRSLKRGTKVTLGSLLMLSLVGTSLLLYRSARGDVPATLYTKTLPEATIALIDPETGTSGGTSGSDIKLAVGDVVLFTMKAAAVAKLAPSSINGWITDYIPANTTVVGVRIVDENGWTIEPNLPGLADRYYTSQPTGTWPTGPSSSATFWKSSSAETYGDTGIFYTQTATQATPNPVARTPIDEFITVANGIQLTGEDTNALNTIDGLLGQTSPYYAHNAWDHVLVRGTGNDNEAPFRYGSPVAGPHSFSWYTPVADSTVSPTNTSYNVYYQDDVGPWRRVIYPGSQVGTGEAGVFVNENGRQGVDAPEVNAPADGVYLTGAPAPLDLTPLSPLPSDTTAIRVALGELRVGEVYNVEIALRVDALPIDPHQGENQVPALGGANVNCSEVFSGNRSDASTNKTPWSYFIPMPNCAFLNFLLTIEPDSFLKDANQTGGARTSFTITAKNLSLVTQSNGDLVLEVIDDYGNPSFNIQPDVTPPACSTGWTCYRWSAGAIASMAPSDEVVITASFDTPPSGTNTAPAVVTYNSDELGAINPEGYTAQTAVVVNPTAVLRVAADTQDTGIAPGQTTGLPTYTNTVQNIGTSKYTVNDFNIILPAGWSLVSGSVTFGGVAMSCSGTGTVTCSTTNSNKTVDAGASVPLSYQVLVPGSATPGLYPVALQIMGKNSGYGANVGSEYYFRKRTQVSVSLDRAPPPALTCDIQSSVGIIHGTSTAGENAIIHIYLNGIERFSTTVLSDGTWTFDTTGNSAFGPLYGGLEIRVTAENTQSGFETHESRKSVPCFAEATRACSDGIDNDGDGLIDFPADPGCDDGADNSELNGTTQCSDGLDNDSDGFIDFPFDPQCSSYADDDEGGLDQCHDQIDNDGDGYIDGGGRTTSPDTDDDPGCDNGDLWEADFPACWNFMDEGEDGTTGHPTGDCLDTDDNGDGIVCGPGDNGVDFDSDPSDPSYLGDPGCHGRFDDDETDWPPPGADDPVKPRLLVVFDTSGSMNWETGSEDFSGGDGSNECTGTTTSRMQVVKEGVREGIANFGNVDWSLMRYHQRATNFACPASNAGLRSGGWQGGGLAPCGEFNFGDLLVGFSPDNVNDIIAWMDGESNYDHAADGNFTGYAWDDANIPPGFDRELRGSGSTPIAGTLLTALGYMNTIKGNDAKGACRTYSVVLVTDGQESCGTQQDAMNAAAALAAVGIKVYVIGFASATIQDDLDDIAQSGGTGTAVLADNKVDLSLAIADIVDKSILREICDGVDNDCDGQIDEDFPNLGQPCDNGELGDCLDTGVYVCSASQQSTECTATPWTGPYPPEQCDPPGADEDCDGLVDEGCCYGPEICDGIDNYCGNKPYPYGDGNTFVDGAEDPAVWVGGDYNNGAGTSVDCGPTTDDGACEYGDVVCQGGSRVCQGGTYPAPEQCDAVDNNCNNETNEGLVRQCYTGDTSTANHECWPDGSGGYLCEGACQHGYQSCGTTENPSGSGNYWEACIGEILPSTEVCDGVDNNCDGSIDEGLNQTVTCGLGVCEDSVQTCENGTPAICQPKAAQTTESCDGLDNDCDGVIDDGITRQCYPAATDGCTGSPGSYSCEGECKPGVDTCVEGSTGVWTGCQNAVTPTPEICNNKDDNCDGQKDEGLSQQCYSGTTGCTGSPGSYACQGECGYGTRTCTAGVWGNCSGQTLPTAEICDGKDNDCNGLVDDGLVRACFAGSCQGTQTCNYQSGNPNDTNNWTTCTAPQPTAEVCDGLDNNCDNLIDEGLTRDCYPASLPGCTGGNGSWTCEGVCHVGTEACTGAPGGQWDTDVDPNDCAAYQGPTESPDELSCDGLDNDCDGTVDENIERECYPVGTGCTYDDTSHTWSCDGICRTGNQSCQVGGGGTWDTCSGYVPPAAAETCDGTDNDCNGVIDDNIAPQQCSRTADVNGVSRTCYGFQYCSPSTGGQYAGCDARVPSVEICDGIDNDCNGLVDDNIAPIACTREADIGSYHASCPGVMFCINGAFQQSSCNAQAPTEEVCDGADNDCDGNIDNAVPADDSTVLREPCYNGPGGTENVGTCHGGNRYCDNGFFGTCVGQQLPAVEECDGLDNDCDHHIDNATPGQASPLISEACQDTNPYGTCLGQRTCTGVMGGGWTQCTATEPGPEVCDGVDNNCDGIIDGISQPCYPDAPDGCVLDTSTGSYDCQGTCREGIRLCPQLQTPASTNNFGACQFAVGPTTEVCDGLDNDCDGFVDEDTTDSTNMWEYCYGPGYGADTGCTAPNHCQGICRTGVRICGENSLGIWGACNGEVPPNLETCDGTDNDCDGFVDEATDMPWLGQPCTGSVGVCNGVLQCNNGVEECVGGAIEPGRCDGQDNDCDGTIDELDELMQDPQYQADCGSDVGACEFGQLECVGGGWVCVGAVEPGQEVCDGTDNDCDSLIDNGAECPPAGGRDAYCIEADCRLECNPADEIPCPPSYECVPKTHETGDVNVCMPIVGSCGGETCPEGWVCQNDVCVDPCADVNCESWQECRAGTCVDTSCSGLGGSCETDEICVNHACVPDPCIAADCFSQDAYCLRDCNETDCTASCEPLCACEGDQICNEQGNCEDDPCYGVSCTAGQRCDPDTGQCGADPCAGMICSSWETCYEGTCFDNPCADIECPWPFQCSIHGDDNGEPYGVCEPNPSLWEPGVNGDEYLATGGGGCQCDASGRGDSGTTGGTLLFLLLGLFLRRRRKLASKRQGQGGAR